MGAVKHRVWQYPFFTRGIDSMTFYFPMPEKVTKSNIAYDCEKCGIYKNEKLINPKMEPYIGKKYDGLVIVGDHPTIEDDAKGIPFMNTLATKLRSEAIRNGVNLVNDAAMTYAACCYKKKVTDTQYKCCKETYLMERLTELKPKLIIACGENAFKSVMNIKNKIGATKIRNRIVPNYEFNCIVFPVFNPNDAGGYAYRFALEQDLKRIFGLWKKNYHKRTYVNNLLKKRKILENIHIQEINTFNGIKETFKQLKEYDKLAFDYEATNVSPYDVFFEITHITFSTKDVAWVIHESAWENDLNAWEYLSDQMRKILTDKRVLKIIQNSKFEDLASRNLFGIKRIENMFCTMLATHVVDERKGCTSLDFQNLMRFGIPPYSDTVKSFLQFKNKDDLINSIRKAPHDDLITYAGLDGITTFNNYLVLHNELLPYAYPKAYDNYEFLLKGHWTFANMTQRGITVGEKEFSDFEQRLDEEMVNVVKEIAAIPEFIEYNEFLAEQQQSDKKSKGDDTIKTMLINTKEKKGINKTNDESTEVKKRKRTILQKTSKSHGRKISFS